MAEITDIRVELESLKQEVNNVNSINTRLDTAIDKLTDVSTSIKSMLAVHEEKLSQSEKIDEVIFNKIRERADELDKVNQELTEKIEISEKRLMCELKSIRNEINDRVGVLERYKWLILGGAIVIGWIMSKNLMPLIHMMNGS
jgi:predicted  nucleic acid-binding Zn-ribbon protein|tara:strand:+ start:363 stop:791 length:429 start_codon:yes stop_codon:yes gene_type:complete